MRTGHRVTMTYLDTAGTVRRITPVRTLGHWAIRVLVQWDDGVCRWHNPSELTVE